MSLNGRDGLAGDGSTCLKELGIVSGDLIIVLPNNPVAETNNGANQAAAQRKAAHNACNEMEAKPMDTSEPKQNSPSAKPTTSVDYDGALCAAGPSSSSAAGAADTMMQLEEDGECIQDAEVNKYLCEPLSVRESTADTVPQTLDRHYRDNPIHNVHDAAVILLHVLMLETGYDISVSLTNIFRYCFKSS